MYHIRGRGRLCQLVCCLLISRISNRVNWCWLISSIIKFSQPFTYQLLMLPCSIISLEIAKCDLENATFPSTFMSCHSFIKNNIFSSNIVCSRKTLFSPSIYKFSEIMTLYPSHLMAS